MIEDLGIAAPADVGYYSGMVDSSFSFAQLLTASNLAIISPLLLTTFFTSFFAADIMHILVGS